MCSPVSSASVYATIYDYTGASFSSVRITAASIAVCACNYFRFCLKKQ